MYDACLEMACEDQLPQKYNPNWAHATFKFPNSIPLYIWHAIRKRQW